MERFITSTLAMHGELQQKGHYQELINPRLSPADYKALLKVASLDIETDAAPAPQVGSQGPGDSCKGLCFSVADLHFEYGTCAEVRAEPVAEVQGLLRQ